MDWLWTVIALAFVAGGVTMWSAAAVVYVRRVDRVSAALDQDDEQ